MVPGLDMYDTGPSQYRITAGEELLDDLRVDRDLHEVYIFVKPSC